MSTSSTWNTSGIAGTGPEFSSNTACLRPEFAGRIATASDRALPNFIIIGAGKCGTTSLQHYLSQHPLVVPPLTKEVHYFDHNFCNGEHWYRAHFPVRSELERRPPAAITGEATPYYLAEPRVPARIAAAGLSCKFIALLRNPVERAYSQYQMVVNEYGFEHLSFADAIDQEEDRLRGEEERMQGDPNYISFNHLFYSYKTRGRYAEQLSRWFAHFPKERFLILQSEEFFAWPASVFRRVLHFLELPVYLPAQFTKENSRKYKPMSSATRSRLMAHFSGPNDDLEQLVGASFSWI